MEFLVVAVGAVLLYLVIYFAVLNAIRASQQPEKRGADSPRPWKRD